MTGTDQAMARAYYVRLADIVRDPRAIFGIGWIGGLLVVGFLAPFLAPHSPVQQDAMNALLSPSAVNWLGTDDLGRDVFSRLIYGASEALYASMLATTVAVVIGVPFGLLAGFAGGWADAVISRIIDTFLSFPAIVLAVSITGVLGVGLINGMIATGIVFSPMIARIARSQALIVRGELYVDAAQCFGASRSRILVRHISPSIVQPVVVKSTLLLSQSLLAEASLSFLGLGVQPPDPSWGAMLARAYSYMEIAPEQMYPPGVAILITALAYNTLGDWLRDALDPTLRSR